MPAPKTAFTPESNKVIDIAKGKILAVTDLHGNLKDFEKVLSLFQNLREQGKATHLVFLGDLIHARKTTDYSVEILDRLMEMGCNKPDGNLFALMGNHEMVHIYHVELWRGGQSYTHAFEGAIQGKREKYIRFLMDMPFAVRSQGGVLLHHTGAGAIIGTKRHKEYGVKFKFLRNWPHEQILDRLFHHPHLEGLHHTRTYLPMAGMWFRDSREGAFLWEFFMNKNEKQFGDRYGRYLRQFLKYMFKDHPAEGTVVVTGHIPVPKGLEIVEGMQLRLSSSFGAESDAKKTVLLFDAEKKYENPIKLAEGCFRLFPPAIWEST